MGLRNGLQRIGALLAWIVAVGLHTLSLGWEYGEHARVSLLRDGSIAVRVHFEVKHILTDCSELSLCALDCGILPLELVELFVSTEVYACAHICMRLHRICLHVRIRLSAFDA
jgi:hypothetical protein